ncbi:kell blood group glycoprotein-like isoform X1 [Seriola lalandi dorsalis]|uniref:Kell metallo-endopeptidase (Kell blood group) n=1 Tax=Seriola lalandi dorsalis TaxID=1841481 RepID=A0A3B4YII2_SERLL|nr:kell blood group glycoprotein-like isoform X1 [Seriola lalandi dorsalis]
MSETPIELELSIQPSSQPGLERGLQSPLVFQLPLPTQDPPETHQQTQPQPEVQLSESNPEHRHQAKPLWIKHRRLLLLFGGFSLCAAFLGLIYYKHQNLQSRSNNQAGAATPCLSPACQRASAHLSTSADPFKEPCDYFLFTCGSDGLSPDSGGRQRGQGILGHQQNYNGKSVWSERRGHSKEREDRGVRQEKILDRKTVLLQYLREILESNNRGTSSAVQKAKGFYNSCLDTRAIETAGVEPFLTLIQKLGGWAASGQWNKTDFNSTLSLLMRDYATFPFFNLYVGKDPNEIARGSTKRYIQIDQPDLLIPIEWNTKTQKSQAKAQTLRRFLATCETYLALLGAPPSSSMLHVGMFMSLSSELAVATSPLQYRLSKGQLYQRMTIKELQIQAPAIDWLGCLQAAFHPLTLMEDDPVLVHNLPYMVQMTPIIGKWLNKHELSSSGPLQTYMVLNLLHTLMPALDSRFSEAAKNLSVTLGNTEEQVAPRWRHCVLETERGFDSVLTHLLRERTARREAEEVIQNIFSSFKSKLHELKWTDKTSPQSVMKKVHSLNPRLWTSNEISSEAELDLLFSKVSVNTHSFFSNYVQLLSLWQKRRRKLLTEQTERVDVLSVTPLLLGNELLFPVGMFVPPLFHPTYPRAMNYGVMGFLLAKDILHLLLPDIYSQSETVRAVGECVWAHYLTVTERTSRGGAFSLSAAQQQEVWVQYSALQIALQAYRQSLKNHPEDTSISGLSHTRLFLSSFSQVNCDFDPYHGFMPLEPSFLITVICAKSHLCPSRLQCPSKTQQHTLQTC